MNEVTKGKIKIIAPSSPYKLSDLRAGLPRIEAVFDVCGEAPLYQNDPPYLNGSDRVRARAILRACEDEKLDFVWAARGGYGLTRVLSLLPRKLKPGNSKLIGYSDTTALMAYLWCAGGRESIHASGVTEVGQLSEGEWKFMTRALSGNWDSLDYGKIERISGHRSKISGRFFPFNLTTLVSLIGTPDMPKFSQGIIGFEEVGEKPYLIDRMLTQLMASKTLNGVSAVVLGHFTNCIWSKARLHRLISFCLKDLKVPVYAGLPFGHQARNLPLKFGGRAEIRNSPDGARLQWIA